jgi:hypothetical protein
LANCWSQNDPYAAATWLGTLSQSPSRDAAVGAFARQLAASDPQTAAQWAQTIGNESGRDAQLESIVRSWLNTDSNRAMAWINASSLSDEVKAKLLPQQR